MFALIGHSSYKNGIIFRAEFVYKHLRIRSGNGQGLPMVINKAIPCLGPFQQDIRTMLLMESEKALVQCLAFFFQHSNGNFNTSLTDFLNATPLHLGKRIYTAHHTTLHTFIYNKVTARRRFSVVCTRFQRHVDGGILQQWFIFGPYGSKGIHLGMAFTATHVIAFADDKAPSDSPRGGEGITITAPTIGLGFAFCIPFLASCRQRCIYISSICC